MSSRWAAELAGNIRGGEKPAEWMLATISTAKPLAISVNGKLITRNLYINPALLLEADDTTDRIGSIFQGAPAPAQIIAFLKSFHQKYVLHKGDFVLVMKQGTSFYISGKVVATG